MNQYVGVMFVFFFQAEDGIRDYKVTGVQTCALPIYLGRDDALARVVHLGDVAAALGAAGLALQRCGLGPQAGHALIFLAALAAVVQGLAQAAGVVLAVAARLDPGIAHARQAAAHVDGHGRIGVGADRKSTRLNSSHLVISYAVFCL